MHSAAWFSAAQSTAEGRPHSSGRYYEPTPRHTNSDITQAESQIEAGSGVNGGHIFTQAVAVICNTSYNDGVIHLTWYGILEFNVPLDTV